MLFAPKPPAWNSDASFISPFPSFPEGTALWPASSRPAWVLAQSLHMPRRPELGPPRCPWAGLLVMCCCRLKLPRVQTPDCTDLQVSPQPNCRGQSFSSPQSSLPSAILHSVCCFCQGPGKDASGIRGAGPSASRPSMASLFPENFPARMPYLCFAHLLPRIPLH